VREQVSSSMLERAVQVAIVATIVSAVLASGAILSWLDEARRVRWAALFALAALAVVWAWSRRRPVRPPAAYLLAAALAGLCLLSAAWSSDPGLTAARAVSLGVLLLACVAVGLAAAGSLEALTGIVQAVAAGTAVVALGGLLVLAFAHDRAVQPASANEPARYQGLGGGPNTATMVLAVGVPLAAHLALASATRRLRIAAGGLLALLLGSIVASGSRGALLAAFGGLLVYALLAAPDRRARLRWSAVAAAALVLAVLAMRLPQPDPAVAAQPGTAVPSLVQPATGYFDASVIWRSQEDVGRPPWGEVPEDERRSLLGSSGRLQAWEGALGLAADRPVAGYGFGLETTVFVDRYLKHGSNQPENSYVGIVLQLGAAGLLLFAALIVALAVSAVRIFRGPRGPVSLLAAGCAGALAAGLVLGLTQSYVYSAGNNATAAVWLCGLLLPAAGMTRA
jgi:O-antigen ligase